MQEAANQTINQGLETLLILFDTLTLALIVAILTLIATVAKIAIVLFLNDHDTTNRKITVPECVNKLVCFIRSKQRTTHLQRIDQRIHDFPALVSHSKPLSSLYPKQMGSFTYPPTNTP